MSYCAAVDAVVNPAIAPGLEALRWHLMDHHYSDVAAFDICHHVLEEGTLAGAPGLYPEDEAAAEAAYVGSLPAVPFADPAWGSDEDLDGLDLPPICGGGPDPADERWWLEQARDADERAEAMESCRRLDELAAIRAAEARAPLYGYE